MTSDWLSYSIYVLIGLASIVTILLAASLWSSLRERRDSRRRAAEFALEVGHILNEAAKLCQVTLPYLRSNDPAASQAAGDFAAMRRAVRALTPAAPPAEPAILAAVNRGWIAIGHAEQLVVRDGTDTSEAFAETASSIWRERDILLKLARRQ